MLKKYITLGILSLTLTCGYAQPQEELGQVEEIMVEECEACGQKDIEQAAVTSEAKSTVDDGVTAKRMRQIEKANNLKDNDPYGLSNTIIAMTITLIALILLCLLFNGFGKISQHFLAKSKQEAAAKAGKEVDTSDGDLASGETIAAIGMALAEHFGQGHDIEDTILTIHQIKKAYSPWNSKIYNLRTLPELHRNVRK